MGFKDAVKTCLGKYVTFSGRASRPEYWWFFLFIVVGSAVFALLDGALFGFGTEEEQGPSVLNSLFGLAVFLPALAVGWRRMHDTGRPGWYILIPMMISLVGSLTLLGGIFGFGAMEAAGADPDALMGPAAILGVGGLFILGILQIAAAILMLIWLTRPSQPETNQYGPPPAA